MAKAYWVSCYRAIRFIVRGPAAQAHDSGVKQRVVIVEFDSLDKAIAAHDGPGYKEALRALGKDSVERDFRIVEGV